MCTVYTVGTLYVHVCIKIEKKNENNDEQMGCFLNSCHCQVSKFSFYPLLVSRSISHDNKLMNLNEKI